ncbi:MAG TPA: hypothetical protein VEY50_05775 [Lysobacter sp.]|nr:hypothetical protein [Lysobacter sp.]
MTRPTFLLMLTLAGLGVGVAGAQSGAGTGTTVVPAENVRYDYAQVMRVTPVYQTLRAVSMEERCEASGEDAESRFSRVVGRVKNALTREQRKRANCRMVPVEREFRRPIAYDVDYVYRGVKFRSRLAEDPGNRLRIRVAVTPAPR